MCIYIYIYIHMPVHITAGAQREVADRAGERGHASAA